MGTKKDFAPGFKFLLGLAFLIIVALASYVIWYYSLAKNTSSELLKIKVKLGQLYANQKGFRLDLILVLFTILVFVAPSFAQKTIKTHFILRHDKALYRQIEGLNI